MFWITTIGCSIELAMCLGDQVPESQSALRWSLVCCEHASNAFKNGPASPPRRVVGQNHDRPRVDRPIVYPSLAPLYGNQRLDERLQQIGLAAGNRCCRNRREKLVCELL